MLLSTAERERLEEIKRKGKNAAGRFVKARIWLQADVSAAGKGGSDSRLIEALDVSASRVFRVRQQGVEEGFDAVLGRRKRTVPPVAPIVDGEQEAQ